MNKFVRLLSSLAVTGALFLAPAAMARTHHTHHAKSAHHAAVHHAAKSHVVHHRAHSKAKSKGRKMSAQQRKMAACAHQSKGMKGAAHRAFMSKCLKKH